MAQADNQAVRRSRQTSFNGHVFVGADGDVDSPKFTLAFDTMPPTAAEEAAPAVVDGVSQSGRTMIFADLRPHTVAGTLDTRKAKRPNSTMTFEDGPSRSERPSGGYVSVKSFIYGERSAPRSVETDLAERPPTREMPAPNLEVAPAAVPEVDVVWWQHQVPAARALMVAAIAAVTAVVATGGYGRLVSWLG